MIRRDKRPAAVARARHLELRCGAVPPRHRALVAAFGAARQRHGLLNRRRHFEATAGKRDGVLYVGEATARAHALCGVCEIGHSLGLRH